MNELGMIVDVAHVNKPCVLDICAASTRPVILTHGGFLGVARDRQDKGRLRLTDDETALAIVGTGGLIGVMFAPLFLSGARDSLACVTRHLDYGTRLFSHRLGVEGSQHLAIGSDFDGWIASIPDDVDDAADMPKLTQALLTNGFPEQSVRDIYGANFLRVWQAQGNP